MENSPLTAKAPPRSEEGCDPLSDVKESLKALPVDCPDARIMKDVIRETQRVLKNSPLTAKTHRRLGEMVRVAPPSPHRSTPFFDGGTARDRQCPGL